LDWREPIYPDSKERLWRNGVEAAGSTSPFLPALRAGDGPGSQCGDQHLETRAVVSCEKRRSRLSMEATGLAPWSVTNCW